MKTQASHCSYGKEMENSVEELITLKYKEKKLKRQGKQKIGVFR